MIQGDRISSSLLQIESYSAPTGPWTILLLVPVATQWSTGASSWWHHLLWHWVLSTGTTITGTKPSRQVLFLYNEGVSRCSGGTCRIGLDQHKLESPRHPPVSVYGLLITWVWARESLIASWGWYGQYYMLYPTWMDGKKNGLLSVCCSVVCDSLRSQGL